MKIDWKDEANIRKLEMLLAEEKSGNQIAQAFGADSRNVIVGAVHRLLANGTLKKGFRKVNVQVSTSRAPRAKTKGLRSEVIVRGKNNQPEIVSYHNLEVPEGLDKFNKSRKGIKLLDLKNHQCRWPVKDDPYLFCGERKAFKSYCATHDRWSRR